MIEFQGIFEDADYPLLGIDWSHFNVDGLEFFGRVNLMKGAIVLSDGATTVSPSYAAETISDPDFGFGLEGVLRKKGERFRGILNGVDYEEWNPATDKNLAANYSEKCPEGKSKCKRDLLNAMDITAFLKSHRESRSHVSVALTRVKDPTQFGLVETEDNGRIRRFLEKPSWDEITCNTVNAGAYLFEPEVVELIPKGVSYSLERGLFPYLLQKKYRLNLTM